MNAECRWCGPIWCPDDLSLAVEFLHAHAVSESHETQMRLDKELNEAILWGKP